MITLNQTNFAFTELTPPAIYSTDVYNPLLNLIPKSFPESRLSDLSHHRINLINLDDDQLKQEWAELSNEHPDIESTIDHLDKSSQGQKLICSALVAKHHFYEYGKMGNEGTKKAINFLEQVLPAHVITHPTVKYYFEQSYIAFNAIGTLLEGFEAGLSGVILISRTKLLKEAKKALHLLEVELKNSNHENRAEWTRIAKEWRVNINIEEKELKFEAAKYAICTTKQFFGNVQIIGQCFPSSATAAGSFVFQAFGWIAGGLLVILSALSLKRQMNNQKFLNGWVNEFKRSLPTHLSKSKLIPEESLRNTYQEEFNERIERITSESSCSEIRQALHGFAQDLVTKEQDVVAFKQRLNLIPRFDLDQPNDTPEQKEARLKAAAEDFKECLFAKYILYRESKMHMQQTLAYKSQALLRKRQERLQQQVQRFQEKPSALKDSILTEFKTVEFKSWVAGLAPDNIYEELSLFIPYLEENSKIAEFFKIDLLKKLRDSQSKDDHQNYFIFFKQQILIDKATYLLDIRFDLLYKKKENKFIQLYLERQQTISESLKEALRLMVQKKHQLERKYAKFKLTESKVLFAFLVISLSISFGISIAALILFPAGGLLLLILSLSLGGVSLGLTVGFTLGSYYLSYKKNPSLWTKGLTWKNVKTKLIRLHLGIQEFSRNLKRRRLVSTARLAQALSLGLKQGRDVSQYYQKAYGAYLKARKHYLDQCQAIANKNKELQELQKEVLKAYWSDFSKQAKLNAKEALSSLDTILQTLDFDLIDEDTRYPLETQLGFNIQTIKKEIAKDPKLWKKSLQKFFSFDDADLVFFIRHQRARQREGGLIPLVPINP